MVQRLHPKSRKGFNLIEAAIVLGVVGLVIGGIWVAAAAVMQNYRVNQTSSAILLTVSNVRNLIHGTADSLSQSLGSDPDNNITSAMMDAGAVPKDFTYSAGAALPNWISGAGALETPMGSHMVVSFGDWSTFGIVHVAIAIDFFNVDTATCIRLISAISNHFSDNKDLIYLNTHDANGNWINGTGSFPTPLSTSEALCPATTGALSSVDFYFSPY